MGVTVISSPSASFGMRFNMVSGTAPVLPSLTVAQTSQPALSVGSGSGQVQVGDIVNLTVASGSPYTLNLLTGADSLGNVLSMATFCGYQLTVPSTNTYNLIVGSGTDPIMGASELHTCQPGGTIQDVQPLTGFPVSSGVTSILTITASSGTVTGTLTLMGR